MEKTQTLRIFGLMAADIVCVQGQRGVEYLRNRVQRLIARKRLFNYTLVTIVLVHLLTLCSAQNLNPRVNQPPVFSSGGDLSRFSIPEDTPVGSVIYRLKGVDPENGELTYSVSGEYFRVNRKTGDLTLIKALDRETEPSIDVIISLTDDGQGAEPATTSLRREILIEDRNDNPPEFNKRPYSFEVSEQARVGSTVFSDILVTDEDWAGNAEINLSCAYDETPLACETFSISAEQVDEGKYVGIVTLARPLDFETNPTYSLTLRATDGGNVVTAPILITVKDVQDAAPNFLGGPYVFTVKENSPSGFLVGNVSVQDGDVGNPRDLQLRLIDESGNSFFRLSNIVKDTFTGTFHASIETTEDTLDAEDDFIRANMEVYELILEAREYPLHPDDIAPTLITRTAAAIMIKDEDDNLPVFKPKKFTRVLKVPYEPEEVYTLPNFNVEVEDQDVEAVHSSFELKFNWNTEEDRPPTIDPATDVEEVFSFITPPNANTVIKGKSAIAIEILNTSLLQPGASFHLEIGAYQHDHLVAKLNVPIDVAKGPRPLPVFNTSVFKIQVPESLLEGDEVTRIQVSNHHKIPGIKYSLIGVGAERFDFDASSGIIKCGRKCLDYEKDKSHLFIVKATAGDSLTDVVVSLLYINVVDTNDNYPVFESSVPASASKVNQIRRSIPDNTIKFDPPFIVKATDADVSDRLTYTVFDHTLNSSGIAIDSETGELKLTKPLSWAESGEHKLTVTAIDAVGHSTEQPVVLIVKAVPNIQPTFPFRVQDVDVAETAELGSTVFRAVAHDPDGQDAAIQYFISEQDQPDLFVIELHTGMIRLNGKLDFESGNRLFKIRVRAQDEGKPSESAYASVHVHVVDENDEKPEFTTANFVTELSESETPEVLVTTVTATDSDKTRELEYDISCPCKVWDATGSLVSDDDALSYFNNFRIEPVTGEIVLINSMSAKKTSGIEFQTIVKDLNGKQLQQDNATVTVYIIPAEKTKPYFGPPWTPGNPWINISVPENIEVGSKIVTFNAFDYIAEININNFTVVETDSEKFQLEGAELTTVGDLDYESKKEFVLSVKAEDIRGGVSIANVRITIEDTNDNQAVFSKPEYEATVLENSEHPTSILTVEASDRDDPENYGAIRFALSGWTSHLFNIHPQTGEITVAPGAIIDREQFAEHKMNVLAIDTPAGGPFQRTSTAVLHIKVEDVNDNDPKCKFREIFVPEDALVGTPFADISCEDPDLNTKLSFSITDDTRLDLFTVNSTTGRLTTAKSLRGRGRNAPYFINYNVVDGNRTVLLVVPIHISNVIPNDGVPRFTNPNRTGVVIEGALPSTPVFLVTAEDTDSLENGEGRLEFKILKQIYPCHSKTERELREGVKNVTRIQDVNYFRIDSQSGMINLREIVDREKHECFSVLVAVEDFGIVPKMDTAWYEIIVRDIDDNMPYLPVRDRKLDLVVNETAKRGFSIYNFTAIDADISPNDRVAFEISGGGSDVFSVRSVGDQNATLMLNGELALLEHNEILLTVKCFPKEKRTPIPDCIAKIHVTILRDPENIVAGIHSRHRNGKLPDMVVGAASGVDIGRLIGNADMPMKTPVRMNGDVMFYPSTMAAAPYNVSDVLKVDPSTGDIYVWNLLDQWKNGHFRVELIDTKSKGMSKNVKVFVAGNDNLLSADTSDLGKLNRWMEEADSILNSKNKDYNKGFRKAEYKILTFDQNNAPDGKTKICFQLMENENMVSQEKALHLLEKDEMQVLFLKYSFDTLQKGCPEKPKMYARLNQEGTPKRFWVERSLLGIASVVAIATISAILILCLVSRHREQDVRK